MKHYSLFRVLGYKGGDLSRWPNISWEEVIDLYFEWYIKPVKEYLAENDLEISDTNVENAILALDKDNVVYDYWAEKTGCSEPVVYEHTDWGYLNIVEKKELIYNGGISYVIKNLKLENK